MRARIDGARKIQHHRGHYSSQLPAKPLRKLSRLNEAGERTLKMAMRRLAVSAKHLDEAVQYRKFGPELQKRSGG